MASHFISDPENWLDRAAEMRRIASTIAEDGIKASIVRLANDYDKLASRALAREGGNGTKAAYASP
jgi:hypothetical protein